MTNHGRRRLGIAAAVVLLASSGGPGGGTATEARPPAPAPRPGAGVAPVDPVAIGVARARALAAGGAAAADRVAPGVVLREAIRGGAGVRVRTLEAVAPSGERLASREMAAGEVMLSFPADRPERAVRDWFSARGLDPIRRARGANVWRVRVPAGDSIESALAALAGEPGVAVAEPNYVVRALEGVAAVPNDPQYGSLWGMKRIRAAEAWDLATGAKQALVAVIDTGVDYKHPDLAANIWKNPGEIAGNGKDDDGNGFVDDVHGYDFANDDGDPFDDHYHGTHVSGTIGAVGNNGTGVAGVNWQVSIMGLKFLGADGGGTTFGAIEAVKYATKMKAWLSSNSWGGGGYSQALKDAIDEAGAAGILFVAAAGNSASDADKLPMYPAAYDSANIVSVAATDSADGLAYFSNYGTTSVDLGAPGVSVLSTMPNATYGTLSGTSMATPHVSGAVALLWAATGRSIPALQAKKLVMDGTDPVPALAGRCVSGGRLNVFKALGFVTGRHLQLVSPNGGEGFEAGYTAPVAWSASGGDWTSSDKVRLDVSLNGGSTWSVLATGLPYGQGSFAWTTAGAAPGSQYLVRVVFLGDAGIQDPCDAPFAVTGSLDRFAVAISSPQYSGRPVKAPATVAAQDAGGRTITTFGAFNTAGRFPVAVSAPGVLVGGLPAGGTGLDAASFSAGVADLAGLGMRATAASPPVTVAFAAKSAGGKAGVSGNVSIQRVPDAFTQMFDTEAFDLSNRSVLFTPNGSADFYAAATKSISQLPTDPAGGTALPIEGLDRSAPVTPAGGKSVSLYGTAYGSFYVASNGYLTFGSPDTDYTESFADHFRLPRVSMLFDDLNPQAGQCTVKQLVDRIAVTFLSVRETYTSDANTFQAELFFDGRIALSYLAVAAKDGLAGLSRGKGVPVGFEESDLSAYPDAGSNPPPVAVVSASPTSGPAPLPVSFDGAGSYDPDGTISSWSWDFGDGSFGTGKTAAHTYTAAGVYKAVLSVKDNGGAAGSASVTIVVGSEKPIPDWVRAILVGLYDGRTLAWRDAGVSAPAWTAWPEWNVADIGGNAAPALGDLDGDGAPDLLAGERNGVTFGYRGTSSGWVRNPAWNLPDVGYDAAPAAADLDGDGDLDVILGASDGRGYAYRNAGSPSSPSFARQAGWDLPDIGGASSPCLGDLDGDGDLDALVGENGGRCVAYRNTGTPAAPAWTANPAWNVPDTGSRAAPALRDLDGDGDLDLVVGVNAGKGIALRNTGTASSPVWTATPAWDVPDLGANARPAFLVSP